MATLQLASWATNLTYTNLPSSILTAANKSLSNWAGCAIGGFPFQSVPQIALHTTLSQFSGPPTSSILGANGPISHSYGHVQTVALINGIASHVDDYDDTHLETIIHPAGPVASALLAMAEAYGPVTGHDFITAFIAGVDAECELGLSVTPEHYEVGWHITSTTGSVGAAVGVGKLLGLDTIHMAHAIGMAATQVIGMQELFGSDTKSFHVGRAAQSGMLAALLAKNGFTSSLQALEAKYGWLHVVSMRENATAYFDQLGRVWEIEKNTFKPYPCGFVMHPAIDPAIRLSREIASKGLSIADIENVELHVNAEVLILTGKEKPQTGLEAKFSIYHATAISLLHGEATPSQFTNAVVANTTVVNLRSKVTATEDKDVSRAEAHVTLTLGDGRKVKKHVKHAKGRDENPLTDEGLKVKFMGQVSLALGSQRAEAAWMAFSVVESISDVARIRGLY